MRREMTAPERRLWSALRNRQLRGIEFSRQVVLGSYIADFCAREHRLIVEVDGDTHASDEAGDERRTALLTTQGYRVIRFSNVDVMSNLEGVVAALTEVFGASPHPSQHRVHLAPQGEGRAGSMTDPMLPGGEREQIA